MGANDLGGGAHDVLAVHAAPQEGAVPEVLNEPAEGRGPSPEQRCCPVEVDRVAAHDERLEDLEMPPVEPVQCPLDAGTRAGTSCQRGQVMRSRAGQVGPTADQLLELVIASTPDVVGEAPEG
jgi:hypothetical protein